MSSPSPQPPDAPKRKHRAKPRPDGAPPAPRPEPLGDEPKRSHHKKKPTAPPAPLVPPPTKIRSKRDLLAALPPVELPPPEERGRGWIPWGEVLSDYLSPIINADGSSASWLGLPALAERYQCALQTIRDRSAAEGWVAQQDAVKDEWWRDRNRVLRRETAHRAGTAVALAFQGGFTMINKAVGKLNGDPDSLALVRCGLALKTGLEVIAKATDTSTPGEASKLCETLNVQQNITVGHGAVAPADSLWTLIMKARQAVGGADPEFIALYEEKPSLPLGITGVVNG